MTFSSWEDTSVRAELHPLCFPTLSECRLASAIASMTVPSDVFICTLYLLVPYPDNEEEENGPK